MSSILYAVISDAVQFIYSKYMFQHCLCIQNGSPFHCSRSAI